MIFIDSSAFIGVYMPRDQCHPRALAFWDEIAHRREPLFTSNLVLAETITYVAKHANCEYAVRKARSLIASERLTILRPGSDDDARALEILTRMTDQSLSFTDCVSFALMRKNEIKAAFAFDEHFERAGFTMLPARV
ncbi:MAG: type II toxin-antitoxin system VapC family toxin [Phycisphaerae bacterium]